MGSVSILIPTGFKDRRRHEIFLWVMSRWQKQFPDWQICLGTDDPTDFNRSHARNDAFRRADGEMIVIADADTATSKDNVEEAVYIASKTKASWVIAHSRYHSLTEPYTNILLAGDSDVELRPPFPSHWKMTNKSQAGVLVMPREAYKVVNGYDERFKGWGYEDSAFAEKLNQRWGRAVRTTGDVVHLWHPRGLDFDQPYIKENEALFEEICNA